MPDAHDEIRRNGGQVIVINPVKEIGLVNFRVPSDVWSLFFGTKIASLYRSSRTSAATWPCLPEWLS